MGSRRIMAWAAAAVPVLAVVLAAPGSKAASPCSQPEVRIFKSEGLLELVCAGTVSRSMPVTFGAHPVGAKEREGDEKTPEGTYHVSFKVKDERFHRFLGVSYPNDQDLERAKANGISHPGGGIGIHGTKPSNATLARIWIRFAHATGAAAVWGPTDGCIALTNEDIEALFDAVPVGAKVVIAATR